MRHEISARSFRLETVLLVVLFAGACGPTPQLSTASPDAADATATASPVTEPPPAPIDAEARCEDFEVRLVAGLVDITASYKRLGPASAESAEAVQGVADELGNWALAEMDWLSDNPPEPRYGAAFRAYDGGVSSLSSHAQQLELLLLSPNTATQTEVKDATDGIRTGFGDIVEAVALLDDTDCAKELPAGSPITPPISQPADPVAAYVAAADEINTRFSQVEAAAQESSYQEALVSIERDASARLAAIAFPGTVARDVSSLQDAIEASVSFLSHATDEEVLLYQLAMFSSSGPMHDQREAAASIRAALGLRSIGPTDLL